MSNAVFIEVDPGVKLFVQDWGSGRPILFIHGWPLSHEIFEYQMVPLMRAGNRVIGIDLRGFGQSDKPWQGNDYDTWADDVGKVIEALDLNGVLLAGFSMGGAIAMHYIAAQGDPRVTKLALMGAAGPSFAKRPDNPSGIPLEEIEGLIKVATTDRSKLAHDLGIVNFHTPASPEFYRWLEDIRRKASPHATICGLEELRDRDLRSELANIHIPTRIFHGVHDQVVPFALAEEQHSLIKGSIIVPFYNSGHGLFYDEKDRLNEELEQFSKSDQK
ncbi:MAG TPA: alpha/beta hydrolase [Methanotrichaceae archaeon]|nr:alpha/beta hydrolase [Methanotrichaceae archaeon]